jgi:quinol monooxygenase YgiN
LRGAQEEIDVIIVSGMFEVDPAQRDQFLAERAEMMRSSRAETGCLEYTFSADPLEPGRVLLFERWESQAALDAHLVRVRAEPTSNAAPVPQLSGSITLYDVSGERSLG